MSAGSPASAPSAPSFCLSASRCSAARASSVVIYTQHTHTHTHTHTRCHMKYARRDFRPRYARIPQKQSFAPVQRTDGERHADTHTHTHFHRHMHTRADTPRHLSFACLDLSAPNARMATRHKTRALNTSNPTPTRMVHMIRQTDTLPLRVLA